MGQKSSKLFSQLKGAKNEEKLVSFFTEHFEGKPIRLDFSKPDKSKNGLALKNLQVLTKFVNSKLDFSNTYYLSISKNGLGGAICMKILVDEVLPKLPKLRVLDLSYTAISLDGLRAVIEFLKKNETIKVLHLDGNVLKGTKMEDLGKFLASKESNLLSVTISGCLLGMDGATAVGNAISQDHCVLTILEMNDNMAGFGIREICKSLATNKCLLHFEFQNCSVDDEIYHQYREHLYKNTTLARIRAHNYNTRIGIESQIAPFLENNSNLWCYEFNYSGAWEGKIKEWIKKENHSVISLGKGGLYRKDDITEKNAENYTALFRSIEEKDVKKFQDIMAEYHLSPFAMILQKFPEDYPREKDDERIGLQMTILECIVKNGAQKILEWMKENLEDEQWKLLRRWAQCVKGGDVMYYAMVKKLDWFFKILEI